MFTFKFLGKLLKPLHPILKHCGALEDVNGVFCGVKAVWLGQGCFAALLMELGVVGEQVMYVFCSLGMLCCLVPLYGSFYAMPLDCLKGVAVKPVAVKKKREENRKEEKRREQEHIGIPGPLQCLWLTWKFVVGFQ